MSLGMSMEKERAQQRRLANAWHTVHMGDRGTIAVQNRG